MTRRYVHAVDVLRRNHVPAHFLWCHRLYVVRAVLDHWFDPGPWWTAWSDDPSGWPVSAQPEPLGPVREERELWRVEASAGRSGPPGVYDLCVGTTVREWALVRTSG